MPQTTNLAAYIWSLADLLRGDFKQSQDDAIMNSSEAQQNQMMQLLSDASKTTDFVHYSL